MLKSIANIVRMYIFLTLITLNLFAQAKSDSLPLSQLSFSTDPFSLRTCCAFGTNLEVELLQLPVPIVQLTNVLDPNELGSHKYDAGIDLKEKNGLLYTCNGGFIDLAHVRDNADSLAYITMLIEPYLGQEHNVYLPEQGGQRIIRLQPIDEKVIDKIGRRNLAVFIAQKLTYDLAVWHEIATWYGFSSIALFPEKVSAFSPEDSYSNILGINIAANILKYNNILNEDRFSELLSEKILLTLQELKAVSKDQTIKAIESIDGIWWDSKKKLPNWELVLKRNFDINTIQTPWRLQDADGRSVNINDVGCTKTDTEILAMIPTTHDDLKVDQLATFIFTADKTLIQLGFPTHLVNPNSITAQDFEAITEHIRIEHKVKMGEKSDQP